VLQDVFLLPIPIANNYFFLRMIAINYRAYGAGCKARFRGYEGYFQSSWGLTYKLRKRDYAF